MLNKKLKNNRSNVTKGNSQSSNFNTHSSMANCDRGGRFDEVIFEYGKSALDDKIKEEKDDFEIGKNMLDLFQQHLKIVVNESDTTAQIQALREINEKANRNRLMGVDESYIYALNELKKAAINFPILKDSMVCNDILNIYNEGPENAEILIAGFLYIWFEEEAALSVLNDFMFILNLAEEININESEQLNYFIDTSIWLIMKTVVLLEAHMMSVAVLDTRCGHEDEYAILMSEEYIDKLLRSVLQISIFDISRITTFMEALDFDNIWIHEYLDMWARNCNDLSPEILEIVYKINGSFHNN